MSFGGMNYLAIIVAATLDLRTLVLNADVEIPIAVVVSTALEALSDVIGAAALYLAAISLNVDALIIVGTDVIGAARTTVLTNQLAVFKVPNTPIPRRTAALSVARLAIR